MNTDHPKILLVDMPLDVQTRLKAEGFNARSGTYGMRYSSERGRPVRLNHRLPNFHEQEVVFITTERPEHTTRETPTLDHRFHNCRTTEPTTNPRPLSMLSERGNADRIVEHGGVFVVLASALEQTWYGQEGPVDNWSFLSHEHWFEIENDEGFEIKANMSHPCGRVLARHLDGGSFSCTFKIQSYYKEWEPIASSKYGNAVAGVLRRKGGIVIIVPQLKDPAAFAVDLLKSYLPDERPGLFPNVEGGRWVHRSEYEQPAVVALERNIDEIQTAAANHCSQLRREISRLREEGHFYYALLTETGPALVEAVEQCLRRLGFANIVNVDASADNGALREDLQILDDAPILVEVKGIIGLPTDDDLLAAGKYPASRMREMKRTDIVALTIINYERHKPALDRSPNPFRPLIEEAAKAQGVGLLKTWDLFRLLRGVEHLNWPISAIAPLFARPGGVDPVPTHYQYIGTVANYVEKLGVIGVQIEQGSLALGDRVAYELPVDFVEEELTSLQINNADVAKVSAGDHAGAKTALTKAEARVGTRVFRIT